MHFSKSSHIKNKLKHNMKISLQVSRNHIALYLHVYMNINMYMYVVWIPSTNSEGAVFDIFHTVFFFSSKIIYYVSKCFFLHVLTREYILSILWAFYTSTYNMTKRKQKSQFIVNKYHMNWWFQGLTLHISMF